MSKNTQPSAISSVLESLLKKTGYATICKEWEVVAAWEKIVGGRMAEVTECERVEDGLLYVKVNSASWRQELSYLKDKIKESIIRETGCDSIKDIVFY